MDQQLIYMLATFVGVSGLVFVVFTGLNMRRSKDDRRLADEEVELGRLPAADASSSKLSGSGIGRDSQPDLFFGEMTGPMAQMSTEDDRTAAAPELRAAGYYGRHAVTQYFAIRTASVIVPVFITAALAAVLAKDWIPTIVVIGIVVSGLGFALPRVILQMLGRRRTTKIEIALPLAVDLITLGITAGQNVMLAIERTARELRTSHPEMAFELELVHRQGQLNTLPHALEQFADRVRVPEVRNMVLILTQSNRLGVDMSSALLEFASNFRTTIRQRADARANRASFWILFPNLFCLFTAAAIVLIGPVVIEMMDRNEKRVELINELKNDPMGGAQLRQVLEDAAKRRSAEQ